MLANELRRRGIRCLLVDPKPGMAFNPQANATQARSMEHFRRLGFADEVRAQGLPSDHPTDIAYFTRYARHELARIVLPTAAEATVKIKTMSGSWSAAELPHRVSQKFVEKTLRRHAESWAIADVRYGWRLEQFHDDGKTVTASVRPVEGGAAQQVKARFLVGADGARSLVGASSASSMPASLAFGAISWVAKCLPFTCARQRFRPSCAFESVDVCAGQP
jgi:2-polyprenyl-6-methoxyphenol hydroxylase-like FAD-dependent oxidoreductase